MTLTGTRIQSLSTQYTSTQLVGTMYVCVDPASGGVSGKASLSNFAVAMSGLLSLGTAATHAAGDFDASGAAAAVAASLSPVATSGAYSSLSGLPTLGTIASHATTDYLASSVVTTAGDLLVGSGSGTVARLAKGTNGYVLTMVGGSVAWAAASGGGASLPLSTGNDPQAILQNAASLSVLSTDSNGNIQIISTASGNPAVLSIDSGGNTTFGPNGFASILGASPNSNVGFYGSAGSARQSLGFAAVSGSGDDTDINNNFAAILSFLQTLGLSS